MANHVCPWYLAYTFDNFTRKMIHPPEKVFGPYLSPAAKILDIGPGLGFSSISMARLIGSEGRVYAVDIQEKMLRRLEARAKKADMDSRIETRLCSRDSLGVDDLRGRMDFVNAFWMVHEVPDQEGLFRQIHDSLRNGGGVLISEPRFHVSDSFFKETVDMVEKIGFSISARPFIVFSRAVFMTKDEPGAA